MYKYLAILILASLLLMYCKAQKKTLYQAGGLGLLIVNTEYPIPLFKAEGDDLPFDILRFETSKTGVTKFLTNISLKPYLLKVGDSEQEGRRHIEMGLVHFAPELKFRVIDTSASSFKVVTNEETQQSFIIKKDGKGAYYSSLKELQDNSCSNCPGSVYNPRWYIFETWERFLLRAEFITKESLSVYDVPGGKVIFENKDYAFLPFQVNAVKGDWIELKKGFGRESNFDSSKNYEGWTKWREDGRLLIDITEHTYE